MKRFIKGYTNNPDDIRLGGDVEFFDNLYLGKYRYSPNSEKPYIAPRSWKKILLYIIIANRVFEKLKDEDYVVVADLGCGPGYLLRVLENNFVEYLNKKIYYYGIDLNRKYLMYIYEKEPVKKIDVTLIHHNLLYGVPLRDKSVDIAVSLEVIKYWDKDKVSKFLEDVYRVLKDDGTFFLSTQGIFSDRSMDIKEYLKKYFDKGFRSAFYLDEFVHLLESKGFQVEKILTTEASIYNIETDLKLEFLEIFPREIVEAFLGFLYDKRSHSKLFILKK